VKVFLKDPLVTIANSRYLVVGTLTVTVLVFAGAFCLMEQSNPHLAGHPKHGYWVACYWAITTMTTVGYGDVTPVTTQGQFLANVLMLWSTFFLLPIAIGHIIGSLLRDRDKFTNEEQEQLKTDMAELKALVRNR
jgi:voltage-gated potassium channel